MSHTGVYGVGWRRAARSSGNVSAGTEEAYRESSHAAGVPAPRRGGPFPRAGAGLSSRAMAFMSGKQAFLQILRQEGVSVMFGNPGTTELPLMDGLAREPGIRYVLAL
jgi:hypothetical protein